jgi:hypothetical protein
MKNVTFVVLSGVIGWIVTKFFSPPPGMEQWMVFLGTGAAIAGAALGIPAHNASGRWKAFFIVVALMVLLGAVFGYRSVVAGEPGSLAAKILFAWTVAIFVSIGFLIELGGLKWTGGKNGGQGE